MPAAIIATGSKTIVDLSDGKALTVYLGCNQPKMQIYNPNTGVRSPDWSQAAGKVVITPVVYVNQTALALTAPGLSFDWRRREGSTTPLVLTANESLGNNILTVDANKLDGVTSGLLTYVATATYVDPATMLPITAVADITFSQVATGVDGADGENAKLAWITGDQVFKYNTQGAVTPQDITVTANMTGVLSPLWQYHNGTAWVPYPVTAETPTNTASTLKVRHDHSIPGPVSVFVNDVLRLKLCTSDPNITDEFSITKVRDGSQTSTVFLANENITFAGNVSGVVSPITLNCNVVAYTGTTKVTPTVGTVSGSPTGMTVTKLAAANSEIPIEVKLLAASNLGGAGQLNGTLAVPITSPVSTTLFITWSKVNTGATGGTGAAGQNAVLFSLYAPDGAVFTNQEGNKLIQSVGYDGNTQITAGATYVWKKYAAGAWNTIAGQTGSAYTAPGIEVAGVQAYQCTMTYLTKTYTDTITLTDKTDNYQASIDSTGGDVFKNAVGSSCLICRIFQNGAEVDAPRSTIYQATNPTPAVSGDFYYKYTASSPQVVLMRYNGSDWVDVTANPAYQHSQTYRWYRRDKDGTALDGGAAFALGKVIYVDGDDVDIKTTFTCEVE